MYVCIGAHKCTHNTWLLWILPFQPSTFTIPAKFSQKTLKESLVHFNDPGWSLSTLSILPKFHALLNLRQDTAKKQKATMFFPFLTEVRAVCLIFPKRAFSEHPLCKPGFLALKHGYCKRDAFHNSYRALSRCWPPFWGHHLLRS